MNTKLMVALVIVGVLAVFVVGLVSAQIATSSPTPNGTTNGAKTGGFFGWMGKCLGFRSSSYSGTAISAVPQQPLNVTVTDPNTNTTTTYQSYGNGYGYGGCMRGFFP